MAWVEAGISLLKSAMFAVLLQMWYIVSELKISGWLKIAIKIYCWQLDHRVLNKRNWFICSWLVMQKTKLSHPSLVYQSHGKRNPAAQPLSPYTSVMTPCNSINFYEDGAQPSRCSENHRSLSTPWKEIFLSAIRYALPNRSLKPPASHPLSGYRSHRDILHHLPQPQS